MEQEIWKPITGFEERYEVSSYGRIVNLQTKNLLSISPCKSKRLTGAWGPFMGVSLGGTRRRVHRLVAREYVSLPYTIVEPELEKLLYDLLWVLHVDGNWQNNHYSNLRWGTPKENAEDTVRHQQLRQLDLPMETKIIPSIYNDIFT